MQRPVIGIVEIVIVCHLAWLMSGCAGSRRRGPEQAAGSGQAPAARTLSEQVNRQWPRVSFTGRQRAAIAAAGRSLDHLGTPQLGATVAIGDLERLLPDLLRTQLKTLELQGLESIHLSNLTLRADMQALHVAGDFEITLSEPGTEPGGQPGVPDSLVLSGTVRGAVAVALRGDQMLLWPVFTRLDLAPTGAGGHAYPGAKVTLISATLQRFVASLNNVALKRPATLSFALGAVDAIRAVELWPGQDGLEITPADRTFVFDAHLGSAAILIDDRGIHILAELTAKSGPGAAAQAPAAPPWRASKTPSRRAAGGDDAGGDDAGGDDAGDQAALEREFEQFAARFEAIRTGHFGEFGARTRILMTKPALARMVRAQLGAPDVCIRHRQLAVKNKRFRETLRAFRKDQIRCTGLRRSCADACRGQAVGCGLKCKAENQLRVSGCQTAKASIRLLNGTMKLGELSGEVDVEGDVAFCARRIDIADDLGTVRIMGRASARARVSARVRVDTSGIGHLACVFPFTKAFHTQAAMDDDITLTSTLAPITGAHGTLELGATIASSGFRIEMKPTPWEQMIADPEFVMNCSLVTLALPAVSIGAALAGKKAPAGVDELTRGIHDVAMPAQKMRLRLRPLRLTLGSETLVLHPVWNDRYIGFEI